MLVMSKDYQKYVIDDLQKYDGLRQPVKASLSECLLVRQQPPQKLHPNPDDEFSMPEIGPNYTIVNNYAKQFALNMQRRKPITEDPLMVEKTIPDGYMLLNGHHRWLAALKIGAKTVPVQIVNLVHKEELEKMLSASTRDKRAVFDLDEVLFLPAAATKDTPAEIPPMFPLNEVYRERLRVNVPALLRRLDKMGYDIWIYTAGYHSVEYINSYFGLYHVKLHGIVNGASRRSKAGKDDLASLKKMMSEKYKETLHIDTDHVLRVQSGEGDFDYITLNSNSENWAAKVVKTVRDFQNNG